MLGSVSLLWSAAGDAIVTGIVLWVAVGEEIGRVAEVAVELVLFHVEVVTYS